MSATDYGFVNEDNLLLHIIVCEKDDFVTLDRIKDQLNSHAYYEVDSSKVNPVINSSIWTGVYFTAGIPYKGWVWNNEHEEWQPPVPMPSDAGETKHYTWSDETLNWVELTQG